MTNLNEIAKEISTEIVKNIYLALDRVWDELGEDVAELVNDTVIAELVACVVMQELTSKPGVKMKKAERQAFTEANYSAVKHRIQECVASGFEAATQQYSGISTQYYCQVKRIPTADRGKLC